jgi:hypothetical protein
VRDLRSETRPTGLLFDAQTPASLQAAVESFDDARIDPHDCRRWAEGFDVPLFEQRFRRILEQAWAAWTRDPSGVEAALGLDSGLQAPARELQA